MEFKSVTAMIPSGEGGVAAAVDFYVRQMGFKMIWMDGSMAGIERGGVAFHLVDNTSREWAENASFSIGVADLDALYAQYKNIAARVGPLEMKSWGRREFHMIVPSGVCYQFYEA